VLGGMETVTIAMSSRELGRLHWMQKLGERRATQAQAA